MLLIVSAFLIITDSFIFEDRANIGFKSIQFTQLTQTPRDMHIESLFHNLYRIALSGIAIRKILRDLMILKDCTNL